MPELSPEHWQETEELFARAKELPPEERMPFLERECEREEVRREVASLLEHAGDRPLTVAAAIESEAAALAQEVNPDERLIGARLGPYRVDSIAGYGGMGAVYRASRVDNEFQQRVAIKLVRVAAESLNVQQRFRQERQILARLSHPNIARLLDGGSTLEGVPYIIMEFIEGEPITTWCERQSLSVERRLELFLLVCEGVAAAHCEQVVHRDLKPANILVTSDGVPKLLDFGIAKFLGPEVSEASFTATRFQAMTPEYASPEQVRGERASAVADIYSLGLVLYEVLTGRKAQEIPDATPDAIRRIVCESEPAAPANLKPELSGDLDNIIRMAIRKEPERRYQSVADLSKDIRRHLAGKPVTARLDTFAYRSAKFLRRNRASVRAAVISAVCVAGGLALAFWLGEPSRPPRVLQVVQLTQSAHVSVDGPLATDGSNVYFTEETEGRSSLAEVSINGGTPSPLRVPSLESPSILDISPDGSNLLVVAGNRARDNRRVWIVPKAGAAPRQVGAVPAFFGAWSRDGRRIFLLDGPALFRVNVDGTDFQKFADVPEGSYEVRAAPASQPEVLRLSIFNCDMRSSRIWEVSADGTGLHSLSPAQGSGAGWPDAVYSGNWIPSGRYYLLRSRRDAVSSFWALRETRGLFRATKNQPVKIYSTPLETRSFVPSRDGKRIFFAAAQERSELVRFDARRGQFLPFLAGIAGKYVNISKDHREIVYTTVPKDVLWKSMADGSGRVQLTSSSSGGLPSAGSSGLHAFRPRWSPDGKFIAFTGNQVGQPNRIYVIPSSGGTPEMIDAAPFEHSPSWSPDGRSLLATRLTPKGAGGIAGLYLVDWRTRKTELLPGSENLIFGEWSPDGRYIAAARDGADVQLLDLRTRQWSRLTSGEGIVALYWSPNSKYIYYQRLFGVEGQPVFRVRIGDRRIEQLMSSKQIPQSDVSGYAMCALSPDDAPIATVVRSNSDIYALDVDLP